MLKNHSDNLARVMNEPTRNFRHDCWLWFHLISNNIQLTPNEEDHVGMRDKMAAAIAVSHTSELAEIIKNKRSKQLLPLEDFNWIKNEKRQPDWLLLKTVSRPGHYGFIPPAGITKRDLLIATIDSWTVDLTQKSLALNDLKEQWTKHKKEDHFVKWFKDDNQKCILAWEWLHKNLSLQIYLNNPFEDYEDLLIFFDKSNFIPDQKILYVEKIKRKWSQQKYRKSLTDKAQYNFILSNKAIERLDSLAKTHEKSRTQILEILLKLESEKKIYLPEQIRVDKIY